MNEADVDMIVVIGGFAVRVGADWQLSLIDKLWGNMWGRSGRVRVIRHKFCDQDRPHIPLLRLYEVHPETLVQP